METKTTQKIRNFNKSSLDNKKLAAIIGVILFTLVATFIVYKMFFSKTTEENDLSVYSEIDPSFFNRIEEPPPPPKIEEPKPKPKVKPKPKPKATPPPPPPRDVFAQNYEAINPNKELIDKINKKRFESGKTMALSIKDNKTSFTRMDGHFKVDTDKASESVYLNRVITADRMIPAILINELISDIEGKISAQIEDDIYGFHGRDILIPRGSRAVGRYLPLQKIGDERLIATWDRIITPEGVNINLKDSKLADTMGRSGGYGEIDRRLSERYGLSILLSTLNAAVGYAISKQSTDSTQAYTATTYTNGIAEITGQILKEQLNVKPRITMRAGTRIFINPTHDMFFPENSSGTVLPSPYYKDKGEKR
ncbi:TrbI/VirB10 family protein [Aliarcobacter thereius]|uniref:TrbI/VirB10 family protein n=1 Tax=Aliarcobacter thereius TaxID=544718 RepID=UPI0008268425|nr:TrbI/VirB10 family protein [Aliarcobacter thereius]OCL90591.1 Type IV secretion system protein virB10 [Aliarcobacter thereius]